MIGDFHIVMVILYDSNEVSNIWSYQESMFIVERLGHQKYLMTLVGIGNDILKKAVRP
jgi:hypothetical protein